MAKILIVEDDDAIRMIISEWVEIFGHTPIMCQNGKEGLDALKNEKDVELILTDIIMPEMDGREMVKIIRSDRHHKSLPILIISGAVSLEDISPMLKKWNTEFLPKPVKSKALKEHIDKLLSFNK